MTIIYCYDAYCNWCFGFSPVIKKLHKDLGGLFHFEVLSGGMILPKHPAHISAASAYLVDNVKAVTAATGARFGADYLWHINNPLESDWYPNSEKPAIALCILKEYQPDKQVDFAVDLLYALQYEGRDLCDDEAYRHLLIQYEISETDFYTRLHSQDYRQKAYDEFALVGQLKVSGYPCVMIQLTDSKFHLITVGYADYESTFIKIKRILAEAGLSNN